MKSMKRASVTILAAVLFCLFVFSCFAGVFHSCNDSERCLFCKAVSELRRNLALPVLFVCIVFSVPAHGAYAPQRNKLPHESLARLCVKLSE